MSGERGEPHREPTAPWKRLAEIELRTPVTLPEVRRMLMETVPPALCPDALRGAVEQAIVDAVARRKPSADSKPLLIVSYHAEHGVLGNGSSRPEGQGDAGWSFFLIERPSTSASDRIELCLYNE